MEPALKQAVRPQHASNEPLPCGGVVVQRAVAAAREHVVGVQGRECVACAEGRQLDAQLGGAGLVVGEACARERPPPAAHGRLATAASVSPAHNPDGVVSVFT